MKKYEKIKGTRFSGYGHHSIYITFRGKEYSATTDDMPTFDLYKSGERGWKTAGNNLYDMVVRKNNLS